MTPSAITVVGLGPGPAEWVSPAAVAALRAPEARRFVRTALHPALASVLEGLPFESFDAVYDAASSLADVHTRMAERLADAARAGDRVVLAVPGDGLLGEALGRELRDGGIQVRFVPGVPLGVGALAAAGAANPEGAQVVDALALGGKGVWRGVELNPRWWAVITGVYARPVAGTVKLALQEVYPEDQTVVVVHHPGLPDEQVARLPLAELDRGRLPLDHLTHVVLEPVPTEAPTGSADGLRAVISRLRDPESGCPWDLEQTHESLVPFCLEEAYEVVDAIQEGTPADLEEELGDLLLQVMLHAELADQEESFDWNGVVRAIGAKLIRRHPHVFGSVAVEGAADVVRNWDALKAEEKGQAVAPPSALDGVSRGLPAVRQAMELARRAAKAGFDWPERAGTLAKVEEELEELLAAPTLAERRDELGDLLFILVKLAVDDRTDPEEALRAANRKFTRRFKALEALARERGWERLGDRSTEELLAGWAEAKARVDALPQASNDG